VEKNCSPARNAPDPSSHSSQRAHFHTIRPVCFAEKDRPVFVFFCFLAQSPQDDLCINCMSCRLRAFLFRDSLRAKRKERNTVNIATQSVSQQHVTIGTFDRGIGRHAYRTRLWRPHHKPNIRDFTLTTKPQSAVVNPCGLRAKSARFVYQFSSPRRCRKIGHHEHHAGERERNAPKEFGRPQINRRRRPPTALAKF